MDRAAKNCINVSLKLANSVMALTGIAILMYSSWMVVTCLRDYQKYSFPWYSFHSTLYFKPFVLARVLQSAIWTAPNSKLNCIFYSLVWFGLQYILFMFLLILVESLITANICLNDDWKKDFPKDRTERFDDFVHYVDSNIDNFKCLGVLIAFSQMLSFFLAMVLRSMGPDSNMKIQDEEAKLPFLHHQFHHHPSYTMGHPEPLYYPTIPPYAYPHGYADVHGHAKGDDVAATTQATPKAC
ncbi:Tetraspanin-19 [Bienertia sinuspersici]